MVEKEDEEERENLGESDFGAETGRTSRVQSSAKPENKTMNKHAGGWPDGGALGPRGPTNQLRKIRDTRRPHLAHCTLSKSLEPTGTAKD